MEASFDVGGPIYLQIATRFKRDIARGALTPGERIAPVRELALALGVNPNTMQRALAELEREGLVYSERTAGRYVTADTDRIQALRQRMAKDTAGDCVRKLYALNFTDGDITALMRDALREEENHA